MKLANEIVGIILDCFGLKEGVFAHIKSLWNFGSEIANEIKIDNKQKFIYNLTTGIEVYLRNEHIERIGDMLKYTFSKYFNLKMLMRCYDNHLEFCNFLIKKSWLNICNMDEEFEAYKCAVTFIVNAIYANLDLLDISRETDIASLEILFSLKKMQETSIELLNDSNFIIHYRGSFAEYIDNATLPKKNRSLNKVHYLNPLIGFYGRENETKKIQMFLNQNKKDSQNIHIWGIAGSGGIGKSKLARYIAEKHIRDMGILWIDSKNKIRRILDIITSKVIMKYEKPILIICDYADSMDKEILELIEHMENTDYRIFFLLINRSATWYTHFVKNDIALPYAYYSKALDLTDNPISQEASYCILDDFVSQYKKTISRKEKEIIYNYVRHLPEHNRCLFLLLTADAYLESNNINGMDANKLLHNYIEHSKQLFCQKYNDSFDFQISAYRLLSIATAIGKIDMRQNLKACYRYINTYVQTVKNKAGTNANLCDILSQLCDKNINDSILIPLQPDIVGEYLFLHEFNEIIDEEEKIEWINVLIENDFFESFMHRCLKDWCFKSETKLLITYMTKIDSKRTADIICDIVVNIYNSDIAEELIILLYDIYKNNKCLDIAVSYSIAIIHIFAVLELHKKDSYLTSLNSIIEEFKGEENSDMAIMYNNIGYIYHILGEYDTAIEFYNNTLNIAKKKSDTQHLYAAYNNIGESYRETRKYNLAIQYYKRSLDICIAEFGSKHVHTATCLNNIGLAYNSEGCFDKAINYLKKALNIQNDQNDMDKRNIAKTNNNIGLAYYSKGEYDKAIKYLEEALNIRKKFLGSMHPDTADSYYNIGMTYLEMKKYETNLQFLFKALDFLFKALDIYKIKFGEDHPYTQKVKLVIDTIHYSTPWL